MGLKLVTSALRKLQDACRQNLLSTCSPTGARSRNITHTHRHELLQASAVHEEATYTTKPQSVQPHTSKSSFEALCGWPVAANRHSNQFYPKYVEIFQVVLEYFDFA